MPLRIDLSNLPAATNDVYVPLYADQSHHLFIRGSRGSGKSKFAAQETLFRLLTETDHRMLALRKVGATVRDSIWAQLNGQIEEWGWEHFFDVNRSNFTLTLDIPGYASDGNMIACRGCDDTEKIKSFFEPTSIWLEEATQFTSLDYTELDLLLRTPAGSYPQILSTFNPMSVHHWIKTEWWDSGLPDVKCVTTTYKDNVWLPERYGRRLEALSWQNPSLYRVYALGEWGMVEGVVYDPVPLDEEWPIRFDEEIYGLDFGFNNPSALVWLGIRDMEIFEREVLYRSHMTNADLIEFLIQSEISRTAPIYCDAAEPGRIQEIAQAGFNALPADKSQGSVFAGITFVKGLKIHGLSTNQNLNRERESYAWSVDRDGVALDKPVPWSDHLMDAERYALWTHLQNVSEEMAFAYTGDVHPE